MKSERGVRWMGPALALRLCPGKTLSHVPAIVTLPPTMSTIASSPPNLHRVATPEASALRAVGVIAFAALTALSAQIAIPLPNTPVPITLQTLTVLVAGALLGPRYGMLSMTLYVALGSAGYHVFAGGNWGLQTVAGATGGYLLGFVAAQPLVGALTRLPRSASARRPTCGRALTALLLGHAMIFACGLVWLHVWSAGTWARTLECGLWPFVPGTLIKTGLALGLVQIAAAHVRPRFD